MSPPERHELISPLERALVVVSHPDDAEFLAAATIAQLTAAGTRVDYVVTTDGGKGTEDPNVTPEELSTTRIAEQRAAADILGVAEIVHLGYPDGYLTPSLDLRRDVVRQIRRFRPDLVITRTRSAASTTTRSSAIPITSPPGRPPCRRSTRRRAITSTSPSCGATRSWSPGRCGRS